MASEARQIIFLTGAPDNDSLQWDDDGLLSFFELRAQRFLGQRYQRMIDAAGFFSRPEAKWRVLDVRPPQPAHETIFHTGSYADRNPTTFPAQRLATAGPAHMLSQLDMSRSTTDASTSIDTRNCSVNQLHALPVPSGPLPAIATLTRLSELPSAQRIRQLRPQTVTVDLVVGVITLAAVRRVTLRRAPRAGEREMDLVEAVVGDETRAGLRVSFWLRPGGGGGGGPDGSPALRELLTARVRVGHVLLLTRVALAEWQGRVYAQSLSWGQSRTGAVVLAPHDHEAMVSRGGVDAAVAQRASMVRRWVDVFVGTAAGGAESGAESGPRRLEPELPPDSPAMEE